MPKSIPLAYRPQRFEESNITGSYADTLSGSTDEM